MTSKETLEKADRMKQTQVIGVFVKHSKVRQEK